MNWVGYDVATLGNHDFDAGQEVLQGAVDYAEFDILCANMQSSGKWLKSVAPKVTIDVPGGITLDVVGVVTSYANGHPDGNEVHFEGLTFEDPQLVAEREWAKLEGDVKLLLSHMGDDRDMALAARFGGYDIMIGGHTHRVLDTLVNGTVIGQTGRKLKQIGVTRVQMRGRKIVDIEYENVELSGFAPCADTEALIKEIEANPELQRVAGRLAHDVDHVGLCNLQCKIVKEATDAEIGIYHRGGVRLVDGLKAGKVTVKNLFDNEPFFSQVHTMLMTPAQLRKLIITKYNDTVNTKESHRVDLYATTPYTIVVDEEDNAHNVLFPKLREGRKYRVAMADYVARNYNGLECDEESRMPILVYDIDVAYFKKNSPVEISTEPLQRVEIGKKR